MINRRTLSLAPDKPIQQVSCRLKTCRARVGNPCVTPRGWGARRYHEPRWADLGVLLAIRAYRWGQGDAVQHLLAFEAEWSVCYSGQRYDASDTRFRAGHPVCKRCQRSMDRIITIDQNSGETP